MIILWVSIWFVAGFLSVLTIRIVKEKRKIEREISEQMMLQYALREKTPTEINALCTTLGVRNAYRLILNNYKVKHGYSIK